MIMGLIGLGRMGMAIASRAVEGGHQVIGYDVNVDHAKRKEIELIGFDVVDSIKALAEQTRIIWLMVPTSVVDTVLKELLSYCKAGDIIIDGGNSNFTDSMIRAKTCASRDIMLLDCGTSGGLYGREIGFCLMVGGEYDAYLKIHELLAAIAAPGGIGYIGPSGCGHYVKMIHNGIEYGLMQAYAEGFQLLKEGSFKDVGLDLEEITRIWNTSAVIRSWLLDLAHTIFAHDQKLEKISGSIAESGMGRWTVEEAHKQHIPIPVIEESLRVRLWSQETGGNFATKVVAMLRHEFGGHSVERIKILE
jgi:6-phosphogluconate dehydrogenase